MMQPCAPERADQVRPIHLLTVEGQVPVPAPLVRVTTCGLLTLEIVQEIVSADPPLACYRVLTPPLVRERGIVPALTLLKLLVSRPQRFAPADWLREQFCRGEGEAFSTRRLDTLAWLLRDLLCPPGYDHLRRQVVAHIRAMSGGGYQLAGYPLVWVDHEALCWNVEQAVRMERFGDDPLPFWERAYALARRGSYLPDEAYSEWAEARREEVEGLRRQSVLALARLLTEREGKAGEEEALRLLRSYWLEHPYEEDILRPLMELLGRRECFQEALACYEKLRGLLEEEEREPGTQTRDLAAYLRTRQLQRGPGGTAPLLSPSALSQTTRRPAAGAGEAEAVAGRQGAIGTPTEQHALSDLVREATRQGIVEAFSVFGCPLLDPAPLSGQEAGSPQGETLPQASRHLMVAGLRATPGGSSSRAPTADGGVSCMGDEAAPRPAQRADPLSDVLRARATCQATGQQV
jgi:hypothetical protein